MRYDLLLSYLQSALGSSMRKDSVNLHFETVYSMIRNLAWHWNYKRYSNNTQDPVDLSAETFSWGAGDVRIFCVTVFPAAVDNTLTGRVFFYDDVMYRITKVDVAGDYLYVHRPMHGTETDYTGVILYRNDLSIMSSAVSAIHVNGEKIENVERRHSVRERWQRFEPKVSGIPRYYSIKEDIDFPTPTERPAVSGTTAAPFSAGLYYYFWAYKDYESGRLSAPGPILEYTATANQQPNVTYGTTGNVAAYGYELCLFRSALNPTTQRVPMWQVGQRDSQDSGATVTDVSPGPGADIWTRDLFRFYTGRWIDIVFQPPPDVLYTIDVEYVNAYGYTPYDEEEIPVGEDEELLEILQMMLLKFQQVEGNNPQGYREAIVAARQQLNYIFSTRKEANHLDPGVPNLARYDDWPPNESSSSIIDGWKFEGT